MSDTQKKIEQACWRHIGVWGESSGSCPELSRVIHCHNCDVYAQAARQVFAEHAVSDTPLVEFQSTTDELVSRGDASLLPLRLGKTWIGVPPQSVHIISEMKKVRTLPNRNDDALLGIVSIQGDVLPCISISKILDIPRDNESENNSFSGIYERLVVLVCQQLNIAVPVDEVRGVTHYFYDDMQHDLSGEVLSSDFLDGHLPQTIPIEFDILALNMDHLADKLLRVLK